MELIGYVIQNINVDESEVKNSTVCLIVNQDGKENISFKKDGADLISFHQDSVLLLNATVRNLDRATSSVVWNKYFEVYTDENQGGVVVRSLKHKQFSIKKFKD
jgi:hypothetical protein